ncbi:MAG: substrate-binding domain-containing protein [Kiritimatiellia bacterium]|jgi:LacI family transcriptional regulator
MKRRSADRNKRVVAALSLDVYSGQRKLYGMIDYFNERFTADSRKWDMDIVYGYVALTESVVRHATRDGVDGFILLCHPPAHTISALAKTRIPAIIETSFEAPFEHAPGLVQIFCDTRALAQAAAHHFAARQVFKAYGYVNTRKEEPWSKGRGRHFAEALAERGHDCSICRPRRESLADWLAALARPAAVCAANDATARTVATACLKAGLKIPDDIAILGFDDDPVFCLGPEPRLSSVAQDFFQCGRLAAEALDRLMHGDRTVPKTLSYGARNVVIRESTMRNSPHVGIVQKALDFIDENCCENIGADDVAGHLGVSRRLIDLRFQEILGHSIYSILRDRKLEEVKRRLRTTDESIADITAACGYTNKTHLKNLFRKRFDMSMREYRENQRQS